MANIKEKDLPVASEIASTDYLRMVDASGASKKILESVLLTEIIQSIKTSLEVPNFLVTTSYGIRVYYRKSFGIRILHIEGNPSGSIGTSGHSFTITNAMVDSDSFYRAITQTLSSSNFYTISLHNNTITIKPIASATAYVNATFVY